MSPRYEKRFDQMIADATVDCYNEEEQVTGLFTMIQDELVVPFQTLVLGGGVTVEGVELTTDGQIVAICTRDEFRPLWLAGSFDEPAVVVRSRRGSSADCGSSPFFFCGRKPTAPSNNRQHTRK